MDFTAFAHFFPQTSFFLSQVRSQKPTMMPDLCSPLLTLYNFQLLQPYRQDKAINYQQALAKTTSPQPLIGPHWLPRAQQLSNRRPTVPAFYLSGESINSINNVRMFVSLTFLPGWLYVSQVIVCFILSYYANFLWLKKRGVMKRGAKAVRPPWPLNHFWKAQIQKVYSISSL